MSNETISRVSIAGYTVMAQQSIQSRAKEEIARQESLGKVLIGARKTNNKATLYFKKINV